MNITFKCEGCSKHESRTHKKGDSAEKIAKLPRYWRYEDGGEGRLFCSKKCMKEKHEHEKRQEEAAKERKRLGFTITTLQGHAYNPTTGELRPTSPVHVQEICNENNSYGKDLQLRIIFNNGMEIARVTPDQLICPEETLPQELL